MHICCVGLGSLASKGQKVNIDFGPFDFTNFGLVTANVTLIELIHFSILFCPMNLGWKSQVNHNTFTNETLH